MKSCPDCLSPDSYKFKLIVRSNDLSCKKKWSPAKNNGPLQKKWSPAKNNGPLADEMDHELYI